MPAYDGQFDPPAPVARVSLRVLANGKTATDVPMLIDSGADVTLLPRARVDELAIATDQDRVYELMAFDGTTSLAQAVQLDLVFQRRVFRGQFLITDQEVGFLGRDIINSLSLTLDGPALAWQESKSGQK
jgi:hypothetical protein